MKIVNGIECDPYKNDCPRCGKNIETVWNEPEICDRCKYGKRRSPNFKRSRGDILVRDNFKCRVCEDHHDDVHHIDGDHHNNHHLNLLTTCKRCHRILHRLGTIKYNKQGLESKIKKVQEIIKNKYPKFTGVKIQTRKYTRIKTD